MARRRIRKPDSGALRMLKGTGVTSSPSYRKIENHLTEYDRVVSDYERRWGFERLPLLVDVELRERFWAQMDRLNEAIHSENPNDVEHHVQVTLRAYAALEKKAREMGGKEIEGVAWTAPMSDGRVLAVVRDLHEVAVVKRDMPAAVVYSVQEMAAIMASWIEQNKLVDDIKETFPASTISKIEPIEKVVDDEIPF